MFFSLIAIALALYLPSPRLASGNYSADLMGPVDTRPDTWGTADYVVWPLKFSPPAGYRVHILRIQGDVIAFPKVVPGDSPAARDGYAGVLAGFQTTAPDGSPNCFPCADNTPLYVQGALGRNAVRIPFDYDVRAMGPLDDATLRVKVASFLNTTGKPIHIEVTFTVTYQFEEIP